MINLKHSTRIKNILSSYNAEFDLKNNCIYVSYLSFRSDRHVKSISILDGKVSEYLEGSKIPLMKYNNPIVFTEYGFAKLYSVTKQFFSTTPEGNKICTKFFQSLPPCTNTESWFFLPDLTNPYGEPVLIYRNSSFRNYDYLYFVNSQKCKKVKLTLHSVSRNHKNIFVFGVGNNTIVVLDVHSLEIAKKLNLSHPVSTLGVSKDGTMLAAVGYGCTTILDL